MLSGVNKFNWTASINDDPDIDGVALFRLLQLTSPFAATNIRDKIFSLYGILKHRVGDMDKRPIKWYYRPDYELSETEVFSRFSRGLIEETGKAYPALNASGVHGDEHCSHILDGPRLLISAYEVSSITAVGETWTEMNSNRTTTETAAMLFHNVAPIYPYTN